MMEKGIKDARLRAKENQKERRMKTEEEKQRKI